MLPQTSSLVGASPLPPSSQDTAYYTYDPKAIQASYDLGRVIQFADLYGPPGDWQDYHNLDTQPRLCETGYKWRVKPEFVIDNPSPPNPDDPFSAVMNNNDRNEQQKLLESLIDSASNTSIKVDTTPRPSPTGCPGWIIDVEGMPPGKFVHGYFPNASSEAERLRNKEGRNVTIRFVTGDVSMLSEDMAADHIAAVVAWNRGLPVEVRRADQSGDWEKYKGNNPGFFSNKWLWRPKKHDGLTKAAKAPNDGEATFNAFIDKLDPIKKAEDIQVGGSHYKSFVIQPAEFISRNNISFLAGCVIKRMCRHKAKNGVEDLKKAMHEIQLIAKYEYGIDNITPQ